MMVWQNGLSRLCLSAIWLSDMRCISCNGTARICTALVFTERKRNSLSSAMTSGRSHREQPGVGQRDDARPAHGAARGAGDGRAQVVGGPIAKGEVRPACGRHETRAVAAGSK